MNHRHSILPLALTLVLSLALAACGGEKVPPIPAQEDVSTTANVVTPADTAMRKDSAAVPAAPGSAVDPSRLGEFRAAGNEPFWSIVVLPAGITVRTPQELTGVAFPPVLATLSGTSYHWVTETAQPNRHMLDLTISAVKCKDTMADKTWTHTALARYDGKELKGCAEGGLPVDTVVTTPKQQHAAKQ